MKISSDFWLTKINDMVVKAMKLDTDQKEVKDKQY